MKKIKPKDLEKKLADSISLIALHSSESMPEIVHKALEQNGLMLIPIEYFQDVSTSCGLRRLSGCFIE